MASIGLVRQEQPGLSVVAELSLGGEGEALAVYYRALAADLFACLDGLHRQHPNDHTGDGGDHQQDANQPTGAGSATGAGCLRLNAGVHKLPLQFAQVVVLAGLVQQAALPERAGVVAYTLPLLGSGAQALALAQCNALVF